MAAAGKLCVQTHNFVKRTFLFELYLFALIISKVNFFVNFFIYFKIPLIFQNIVAIRLYL